MFTLPKSHVRAVTPLRALVNDFVNTFDVSTPGLVPALDFLETDTAYVAHVELPGVAADAIEVSIADGRLEIRGEKKAVSEQDGDNWHRVERRYGSFVRSVTLPGEVDAGNVTAESKNGVLVITLPKREDARPRKINVTVS
ncbi:MAG: Hsp20/alpha crystallin family protein [Planctomycetota bacterium]|nr:Hsp20/alpha crystallin family protein [Planctomycetota bacterium]